MELLRDRSAEFDGANVRAVGISRDSPWSHVAWMQALDLNFPLLSDCNAEAVRGFGIAHEFRRIEDPADRTAFLIDQSATARVPCRHDAAAEPDSDEFLSAARRLCTRPGRCTA